VKRFFDFCIAVAGLVILLPLFLFISVWIVLDSKGPVFFRQVRVGKYGNDFVLYKFRTMYRQAEKKGLLTVGSGDSRITRAGYYLRKYKLDELPQLLNVLIGNMSMVGPRPEVRKYVNLYSEEQKEVLLVKPGITDEASIVYRNENDILSQCENPEETYVKTIMPHKIVLTMKYIRQPSFANYIRITFRTLRQIVKN